VQPPDSRHLALRPAALALHHSLLQLQYMGQANSSGLSLVAAVGLLYMLLLCMAVFLES
jgi:hypothetical protein